MKLIAALPVDCRGTRSGAPGLTVQTGETWLFAIKNGEPAQAREVTPSAKTGPGRSRCRSGR